MTNPSGTSEQAGIPGLRGTDHFGITVPDLAEAHHFFVTVLGCEHVYSVGPFLPEGDWMREHLNVPAETVMREARLYRCRTGSNYEVFHYEVPGQAQTPPANSDVGGNHIALYVDDIDQAVAYLREHGVRILGEPHRSTGDSAGQRWVYFLSPWGQQFELVSFPQGKAYEARTRARLWDPRDPAA